MISPSKEDKQYKTKERPSSEQLNLDLGFWFRASEEKNSKV